MQHGMVYAVPFSAVAYAAAQDLWEIAPATNRLVVLHAAYVGQTSEPTSEEEQIVVRIVRGHATSGSGGTSPNKNPMNTNFTAAGFTAEANNTTIASTGTPLTMYEDVFNTRSGWQYIPTPETRIMCKATSNRIVVRLPNAPADSITLSGVLYVEEI